MRIKRGENEAERRRKGGGREGKGGRKVIERRKKVWKGGDKEEEEKGKRKTCRHLMPRLYSLVEVQRRHFQPAARKRDAAGLLRDTLLCYKTKRFFISICTSIFYSVLLSYTLSNNRVF